MLWRKEVENLPITNSSVPPVQGSPRSVQLKFATKINLLYVEYLPL